MRARFTPAIQGIVAALRYLYRAGTQLKLGWPVPSPSATTSAGVVFGQGPNPALGMVCQGVAGNNIAIFEVQDGNGTPIFSANTTGFNNTNVNDIRAGVGFTTRTNANHLNNGSGSQVRWYSTTDPFSGAADTGFKRLAAAVVQPTDGGAGIGAIQNPLDKRRTATQTVTDTVTFATDNTLSATVTNGRRYDFEIWYAFTTVNTSGVKIDLNGGGATVAAINGQITVMSSASAVLAGAQVTALTSTTGATATGTLAFVLVMGSFEASSTGTFAPRFAQNLETGAAESVIAQIGSYMRLSDVS